MSTARKIDNIGVFEEDDGAWLQTISGRRVSVLHPTPDQIFIEDIASPLSKQCRYNGHCSEFYSVAQHCVLGVKVLFDSNYGKEEAREFLLHDATEAYVGDLIRPVKVEIPQFQEIEKEFEKAIATRFNLPHPMTKVCKDMDNIMLAWEKRDLLPNSEPWPFLPNIRPYAFPKMVPWSWEKSYTKYLKTFKELFNEDIGTGY